MSSIFKSRVNNEGHYIMNCPECGGSGRGESSYKKTTDGYILKYGPTCKICNGSGSIEIISYIPSKIESYRKI